MKKLLLIVACGLSSLAVNAQLCLSPSTNFSTNTTPNFLCYADFNNDGKKDIATANWSPNNISVLLGNGAGGFGAATTFTVGNGPQGICSADFNNDGNADLAVTLGFSGVNKVAILLGNGSGGFGPATSYSVPTGPVSVVSADFNGDGNIDLATANYSTSNVSTLFGNGLGGFTAPVNYSTSGSNPRQIIIGDFNGDSKIDLVTVNGSDNISILVGVGVGSFSTPVIYSTGTTSQPYQVCSGDFNGDSKLDLATANYIGSVSILTGNGTGVFSAPALFAVGTSPNAITTADLDGDTKLDLVIGDYNDPMELWVMIGDGTGNFGSSTGYDAGLHPFGVIATDLDGNGKKDLVTCNYNGSNISVLLNGAPNTSISGNLSICSGMGTSLSGTSAQTYSWSSGGTNQFEFVSPGVGTTTYTLTEANGVCTATAVATVTVTATPTITITGNVNICSGTSTILTGGTAGSYTWMPGGVNTSTVSVSPVTSTIYTLTGANGNCISNNDAIVNVTATPTVIVNGIMAICSGQNTTLSGSTAGSYTWSSGGSGQTELVTPTSTESYTLTEANGVCTGSAVVTVTVTPTPTISISGAANICSGSSTVLSGSGATNYTWSANAGSVNTSTANVNPTVNTAYTLAGGDPLQGGTGECVGSATATVNVVLVPIPNICMVTTDSMSINNIVFWDKTIYTNMDSFIVYREVSTNIYVRVGAVSKDSLSMFADTNRLIGPANGDPNIGFYRYKLQLRDTCGNYSLLSPYHTSVYFVDLQTGTFSWNTYNVEGQATPVANFILRRDNANNNIYVVVGTVSGNTTILNDPNYGTYQTIANWRIDATGFNCTPTMRYGNNGTQVAIIKSKSNITNNRTTGMNNAESYFSVYPNPTSGNLTINFTSPVSGKVSVKVLSAIGQEVYSETFTQTNENHNIDLTKQEAGIYFVQITTNNTTTIKRIVKN